jgi:hypothetical protein
VVLLGGSPGKVVAADLNVVVREFAELVVVHTEKLGLFGGAELETGDEVDAVGKDGSHNKGVSSNGDDVGNLDVQLLPLVVEPSSSHSGVDTVHADDEIGGEETVEDETDHASDSVLSEHIHGIVDADQILDLGAVIANDTGADTKEEGSVGRDETGSRRGSNESRDQT